MTQLGRREFSRFKRRFDCADFELDVSDCGEAVTMRTRSITSASSNSKLLRTGGTLRAVTALHVTGL